MVEPGVLGFATLLLGVTTGRQQVGLMVSQPVAEVRVLVDGAEVARLDGPPWGVTLDLGRVPRPHRVEAIGHGGDGSEVGRAVQWVNLPRPEAEVDLLLERDGDGRPTGARLSWAAPRPAPPTAMRATLDGAPVAVAANGLVPLPELDRTTTHLLRVEAEFAGGKTAAREIAFGGVYADDTGTALTAIPVLLAARQAMPRAEDVAASGAGGAPLRVVAVEEGRTRLVAVLGSGALPALRKAGRRGGGDAFAYARRQGSMFDSSCNWLRGRTKEGDDALCVLDPRPERFAGEPGQRWLFNAQEVVRLRLRDFIPLLVRADLGSWRAGDQALSNAVATAGLLAAAGGRRRAVLLVVAALEADASTLETEHARTFLRTLGVPLHVWSPVERTATAASSPWGPITDVSTCSALERATGRLTEELERQRIVWLEGEHLPQEVTLTSAVVRRVE